MLKKVLAVVLAIVSAMVVGGYVLYLRNTVPVVPVLDARDVASARKPIVVKLHAQWCVKCMATKDVWADIEKEYANRVHLLVMDFTDAASTEVSRKEAHRLGLDRFFEEFSGATGIVVVLDAATKEVAAELGFSRDLSVYRAAIDAALVRDTRPRP